MPRTQPFWNVPPLPAIRPEGWIHDFLTAQRHGLTGHLEVAGYPFNTPGWEADQLSLGDRGGAGWWPYEQVAYWVDGMMRCGLLLDDDFLKKKARRQIDYVLAHPDADGYLGPDAMKTLQGEYGSERWPHAVMFRALLADADERPAKPIVRALMRHYLSGTARHDTSRNVCNIEIMAWLFERTGDPRIKQLAVDAYRAYQRKEAKHGSTIANMLSDAPATDHGPRYMELFKLGAIMHRLTGNRRYLKAALNAHRKLQRDHVLIDGVPSATEHLRGIYSQAGHETCVITDYLWSLGHLLIASRDPSLADCMERICFNALPGAVTPDFRALQYFSGPNQVVAGPQTNHHPHGKGHAHVSYRPNPATECCPGNVHRAMPAFAGRMWLEDGRGGVVAALYGPSRYTTGRGASQVSITEETTYPFGDRITFRFSVRRPTRFPFTFRIPGWCTDASVTINGRAWKKKLRMGTWATLERIFADGDVVELHLPRELKMVRGPEKGWGVEWGPLVLSLDVVTRRTIERDDRSTEDFPAWTMMPASAWNVALVKDRRGLPKGAEWLPAPASGNPWDAATTPLRLRVIARRVPGWKIEKKKRLVLQHGDKKRIIRGDIQFTPPLPDANILARASRREETVTLVPLGATRLRVTWFPVVRA